MDIGTVVGLVSGLVLILSAIVLGGDVMGFVDVPSVLIVVGGSMGATFIRFTLGDLINSINVAMKAFFVKVQPPEDIIRELVTLSNIARKEGLLKLEKQPINDEFLKKAIMYCVDGHDAEFIQEVLDKEIDLTLERHDLGQGIFRSLGDAAPAFGMIGTLIGLVKMLGNMKDPASIGPSMAVALLTTLYGAIIANLMALPIADKLRRRSQEEELNKRLVVEGVLGLQKGLNPRVLEELLKTFLPPKQREGE
ncbi:flagellar motor protein PomA [Dissulfurirhabdus thermomarina]|uniref:Flagellar motor protein PomA n=1 Tax=Dissulfurirhabdus thermomarina TaxID=1765737 RepID=A0A6N9TQN9_DISTH|nr:MotA/TolQ/ExbB proton channel family protein [Dissulfurirhabdus thermomarina]NDY42034.1 flagellar motor protein PomA [Dissulfurirhabdus thermomarina]NMX23059.1 flagellar motor protein PomA [Dissulfurirhabdus thermomarina]